MSLDFYLEAPRIVNVYEGNVTHNLGAMAKEAGVYQHLWRPDEINVTHARQLIEPLQAAVSAMDADPARFKPHNPENGWGDFDGFRRFVREVLVACIEYPDATVRVWP